MDPDTKDLTELPDDMPVVARMIVEIRSDGTRTKAVGAMEDLVTGQQVAIETPAMNALELSAALAKSLLSTPLLAGEVVRALVPRPLRRLKERFLGRKND